MLPRIQSLVGIAHGLLLSCLCLYKLLGLARVIVMLFPEMQNQRGSHGCPALLHVETPPRDCAWQRDTASVHTEQIAQSLTKDARDVVFEACFDFDSGERDNFFFLPWFLDVLFLDRIMNSLLEFLTFKQSSVFSSKQWSTHFKTPSALCFLLCSTPSLPSYSIMKEQDLHIGFRCCG